MSTSMLKRWSSNAQRLLNNSLQDALASSVYLVNEKEQQNLELDKKMDPAYREKHYHAARDVSFIELMFSTLPNNSWTFVSFRFSFILSWSLFPDSACNRSGFCNHFKVWISKFLISLHYHLSLHVFWLHHMSGNSSFLKFLSTEH